MQGAIVQRNSRYFSEQHTVVFWGNMLIPFQAERLDEKKALATHFQKTNALRETTVFSSLQMILFAVRGAR